MRAKAVMLRAVDRLSMRITRSAFEAWRDAARARKARRTALARFMQRWAGPRQLQYTCKETWVAASAAEENFCNLSWLDAVDASCFCL